MTLLAITFNFLTLIHHFTWKPETNLGSLRFRIPSSAVGMIISGRGGALLVILHGTNARDAAWIPRTCHYVTSHSRMYEACFLLDGLVQAVK